jgi:hypothetical protein
MSHLSPATQKALTNIREYLAGHLPEGPPNTFTTFKFVALSQNFDMELEGLFSQPPAGHVAIEQGAKVGTVSLDLTSGDFSASWKPYPSPAALGPTRSSRGWAGLHIGSRARFCAPRN